MKTFRQDLSAGFRLLFRQPGFTGVVVLTLTLGVGVNVTMVSFAKAILFPSLPYSEPDRLVVVERWNQRSGSEFPGVSYPTLSDWEKRNRVFSDLSVFFTKRLSLSGQEGDPESLEGLLVSASALETLGVSPVLGRGFVPEDDKLGAHRTVLLGFELWQRRFGGDDTIVGSTISLDDEKYRVIGVLPLGLSAEKIGRLTLGNIWLPINLFYSELEGDDRRTQADYLTVCRLEAGFDVGFAGEDMARLTRELAAEYPTTDKNKSTRVIGLTEYLIGQQKSVVLILLSSSILILILVCANLLNLFLARFVSRRQEFAVRRALGASRRRLVLQGLSETLALTLVGGATGSIAAWLAIRVLSASVLTGIDHADQARVSPLVLALAFLLSLLVNVFAALVPAFQTISSSWEQSLTKTTSSRTPMNRRLREALIIAETAMAVALVTGTGLALKTFVNLRSQNLGFATDRVISLEMALPSSKYSDVSAWTRYFDEALARIGSLPDVEAVAVTSDLPLGQDGDGAAAFAGDRAPPPISKRPVTYYFTISPEYFHVMDIPIVEGRSLDSDDDDDHEPVIMISQSLARAFWPDESAIDKEVGFEWTGGTMEKPELFWRRVVGVAADVRYHGVRESPRNAVYVSYTQGTLWDHGTSPRMALVVKTLVNPESVMSTVRSELLKIDSNQPIFGIRKAQDIVEEHLQRPRMVFALLSAFASLALVLAIVGIYGIVNYIVTATTREIGVRMALGASPAQILRSSMLRHLSAVLIGTGVGLFSAAAFTRVMEEYLYGVDPMDPVTFVSGTALLIATALLAMLAPSIRAARVNPSHSLRYE